MAELIQDIKPRITDSAYVSAPFDEGKAKLEAKNYRVISLEENVGLRIQEGKDAIVSIKGNWVREGILYLPDKRLLTKKSSIIDSPNEATDCNRKRLDYYLTDEQVEKALEDSFEIKETDIPTNRFEEDGLTVYIFGKNAEQYGRFLEDVGIISIPIWLGEVQEKPFVKQLMLCNLYTGSELGGGGRYLHHNNRLRGIKYVQE